MDEAENQITDLEHKEDKNNQSEQHEAKGFKKETKHPKLCKKPWDNFKHSKICIIGVPEGEEKQQEETRI